MKHLIPAMLLMVVVSAHAKIWIVDSNPGSTAKDFVDLNAAYSAAAAGDTLYLIGSPNNYLTTKLVLSKRLIIIGPGYFLDENPDTQINPVPATLFYFSSCDEALLFDAGSEGSIMMGVQVNAMVRINTNNISLRRNFFNNVIAGCFQEAIIVNGSNCLIQQNYISGPQGRGILVTSGNSNFLILDNLVRYYCYSCGDPNIPAIKTTGATGEISNNVIEGALIANNALIQNNIFPYGSTFNVSSSVVRNNIHAANNLPVGNGNQNNVLPTNVFEFTGSSDGRYKLKTDSPGLGAGFGGVDCGMYGGLEPYVLSGIPPIPNIYSLTAPAIGEKNIGLPITIKIKSNN